MKKLEDYVRSIPDFPEPGIIFRDVTTILQDADGLAMSIDQIRECLKGINYDVVVGPESRGFIFGVPVAYAEHKPFVPVRKKGKLPCETVQESYAKEYGIDTIEIHKDAISEKDTILLHDDLLATGGTMKAACNLVKKFHPKKIYCNFIIELSSEFPNSRELFDKDVEITSLLKF